MKGGKYMAKLLSLAEQETVIVIDRASDTARLYTSDTRFLNRFKRLYADKETKQYKQDGEVVAREFEVDKRYITFRSALPKRRQVSDEEKKVLLERLAGANKAVRV
jgi:hypothetical protein